MRIRNKKTGWEGHVDTEGWNAIKNAGWEKKFTVISSAEPKKVILQLPAEVLDFKGKQQNFKEKKQTAAEQAPAVDKKQA